MSYSRHPKNVFNRSGLAAISDLRHPEHNALFNKLEIEQAIFIENEHEWRSVEYKLPRKPLYDFSRVWEYPYVFYHFAEYRNALYKNLRPIIADVGSGVTFFPFALAKLGYQVVCTDIDRTCEIDLKRAIRVVPHRPGEVAFRLIDQNKLPFRNEECDGVYCISVLEHIPNFESTITEMARVIRPGGLCVITCDISMEPKLDIQFKSREFNRLVSVIEDNFHLLWPEKTIHPIDVLTTHNSLYPREEASLSRMVLHVVKQRFIKPILGRGFGRIRLRPPVVSVLGLTLKKGRP